MRKINALMAMANPTPETLEILSPLASSVDARFLEKGQTIGDVIEDVEVLYGLISPSDLKKAKALRWVQTHSTGVDEMLYPEFKNNDMLLTGLGSAITTTVAEHAVTLLLSLMRNIHRQRDLMKEKKWQIVTGVEISGSSICVLGFGKIGRAVASRLQGFETSLTAVDVTPENQPAYVDRFISRDELDQHLGEFDALVCCLPATTQTEGFMSAERFGKMKSGSYFVNISRGQIVDQEALLDALRQHHLAGAGLDVTNPEPLPPEHPLWEEPNLILTPHSAGFSQNLNKRKIGWFAQNLQRYLKDQPLRGLVDKQREW